MQDRINSALKRRFHLHGTKVVDTKVTIKAVYDKYNGICQHCGIKTYGIHPPQHNSASMEHKIPLSKGGNHTWDNVELLCYRCNTGRDNISKTAKNNTEHIELIAFKLFGYKIQITKESR